MLHNSLVTSGVPTSHNGIVGIDLNPSSLRSYLVVDFFYLLVPVSRFAVVFAVYFSLAIADPAVVLAALVPAVSGPIFLSFVGCAMPCNWVQHCALAFWWLQFLASFSALILQLR